jgi:hypothetical protein
MYTARYCASYLNTEVAAVHVVAQEEIACLGRVATNFEQLHKIVVLPVNVTTNGDGCVHLQEIWLCPQDLCALLNDP